MTISAKNSPAVVPDPNEFGLAPGLRATGGIFSGGTRKVNPKIVWERFGDTSNYVEFIAGGLRALAGRPNDHDWWNRIESINDPECFIANFWRSFRDAPDQVAAHALMPAPPVARWDRAKFTSTIMSDPNFYDIEVAALWLASIQKHAGTEIVDTEAALIASQQIANRLRGVRVSCGAWTRLLKQAARPRKGQHSAIFLDPPLMSSDDSWCLYTLQKKTVDTRAIHFQAREWALANGSDPRCRIVHRHRCSAPPPVVW